MKRWSGGGAVGSGVAGRWFGGVGSGCKEGWRGCLRAGRGLVVVGNRGNCCLDSAGIAGGRERGKTAAEGEIGSGLVAVNGWDRNCSREGEEGGRDLRMLVAEDEGEVAAGGVKALDGGCWRRRGAGRWLLEEKRGWAVAGKEGGVAAGLLDGAGKGRLLLGLAGGGKCVGGWLEGVEEGAAAGLGAEGGKRGGRRLQDVEGGKAAGGMEAAGREKRALETHGLEGGGVEGLRLEGEVSYGLWLEEEKVLAAVWGDEGLEERK